MDEGIAEHNMVNISYLDLASSRVFSIRYLALQKSKFPPIMLILEYEGEFHKSEKVFLAQVQGVLVLKSFIYLALGRSFMLQ